VSPEEEQEPNWVVRAGVVTPESLISRSSQHFEVHGLFGFSVQHQPGRTVEELADAGRFPNAQISVTTVEQLVTAGAHIGYMVRVVKSLGRGYHHTVVVPAPTPPSLAEALSRVFIPRPNPARVVRP
jgi:hypothetical protein